ncbi:NepR family anti-sigma factor [Stappia sp.]|uniref:NepR family anti-sigma factor n=1 Tax=Stappia sp. TaxID=1870903 RepID=UPI0032D98C56
MTKSRHDTPRNADARALSDKAVEQIGRRLRESYDEMVKAPVPDRFSALLDELEKADRSDRSE